MLRDDGLPCDPHTDLEWLDWVAAGETRNWCKNDLLLDWLDEYPTIHGFVRDDRLPGYDQTFDLGRYLMQQGRAFEKVVLADLAQRWQLVRITHRPDEARLLSAAIATQEAMEAGVPIIAAGVLRDPQLRMFGVVDLLVRSDVLGQLCPAAFVGDPLELAAIGLSHGRHYRVVDVKFKTLDILKTTGGLSTSPSDLDTLAQAWVYNEALGRMQGYTPPASYVAGRAWKQGDDRGDRCWDRLARVPHDTVVRGRGMDLREVVQQGAAWVRRVRTEGAEWRVLPLPSVPELWPNMKADQDGPWHDAKARIAAALADLTLLPRVNTAHRARAHDAGVTRWDDPRMSAQVLGISNEREAAIVDAVLAVNRPGGEAVRPERMVTATQIWRQRAAVEVFVDFEFLPDLGDDFAAFPRKGGQSLIFQIGCGTYLGGEWRFRQFTVDDLSLAAEARMIDGWLAHLRTVAVQAGCEISAARLVHWSPAETSNFERAYDNARVRHPDRDWPVLAWFDLLHEVVQAEPLVVRGAFSFSLKPIARSLHALGHIQTLWGDGLADGAGAMAGAWNAAVEAKRKGVALGETEVMGEIARYNEVDCRVMAELLDYLRRER
ncbi:MAG TPA: hypothetical protein VGS01_13970 [Candidatus Limnocylindria bacterium]|nr:hypothetical protein [Candidatus Limnocylindria bacterium]